MYNTSVSLLRILSEGYLFRGGIAFGDAYFDELGFFGLAVEEAYEIESKYSDVPIVALANKLWKSLCEWEENSTDMSIVDLLMTSKPILVERCEDKYFLNMFYQLEGFNSGLMLENKYVEIMVW